MEQPRTSVSVRGGMGAAELRAMLRSNEVTGPVYTGLFLPPVYCNFFLPEAALPLGENLGSSPLTFLVILGDQTNHMLR